MRINNLLICFAIVMFISISFVSADLGTFQRYKCVNMVFPINATAVNLTLQYPNLTFAVQNSQASNLGNVFNYTFCNNRDLGVYPYSYRDQDGNYYGNSYTIGSGIWVVLILLIAGFLCFTVAVYKHIPIVGFAAGILWSIAGVYLRIYGFDIYDNLYTQALAYVSLFLGLIIAFAASYEWFAEGDGDNATWEDKINSDDEEG